ncbi:DUF6055 domain-containing protein [Phocaeicola sp.]
MKYIFLHKILWLIPISLLFVSFSSCSDNDDENIVPQLTIESTQQSKTIAWDEIEASVKFTATATWTAVVEDVTSRASSSSCSWVKLPKYEGVAGDSSVPMLFEKNDSENYREATITLTCGESKSTVNIRQEANPNAVLTMNIADIPNYDKYYTPSAYNDGFAKGAAGMLKSDAKWSWWRMKQSEHFFVFWEPGFGDDPNAESVPEALRVDIDDLLAKAEQFYKTNIETLKFAEVGQNKSFLDKYKMEIYLLYQTEWLATGSGYDNTIGALWVNPSTCQPVGSTIAHEIGHSFQYQVSCDKVMNGEADYTQVGFRYGYGDNGEGGNAFWEQCAQWQSFQDYPGELFGYHVDVWKANYHRHFNHEWMRYASYWLQYYWTQKHGVDVVGKVWTQSQYPEDPLMTYQRLYCNNRLEALYAELYDYAAHMVTYDIDVLRNYVTDAACSYSTKLYEAAEGYYQVGYASCPGTTGFNIINLNVPEAGQTVKAHFEGMAPGAALADDDAGVMVDGDGNVVGNVTAYNLNNGNTASGWRYGFVAIVNGNPQYAPMNKESKGEISYTVPAGTEKLYLVVMGAPDQYNAHPWNDNEADDLQWPYKVKFEGTDLPGRFTIDETAAPKDITLTFNLNCNAALEEYAQGAIDLSNNRDLAQAFVLKPTAMEGRLATVGAEPAEDKVVIALAQADDTYSYTSTANNGFWCEANGNIGSWGDAAPVFIEFNGLTLNYGHRYGVSVAGEKYTLKPTLIYTKNGVQYKATLVLNMQF